MEKTSVDSKRKNAGIAIIVIGVVIIAVIAMIAVNAKNKKGEDNNNIVQSEGKTIEEQYEENKQEIDIKGTENIMVDKDLTTVNTSSKVKENKKVAGLDITGITVEYNGEETRILGTVSNNSGSDINVDLVTANIKDSAGNTFRTLDVYIGGMKAGVSRVLDISTQADLSNMYDIEFVEK